MSLFKITDLQVVASYTSIPRDLPRRPLPPTISLELSKLVMKHIDVAMARRALRALPAEDHSKGKEAAASFEPKALEELRKVMDPSSIKKIEFDKRPPVYIPMPPVHEIIRPLLVASSEKGTASQWVMNVIIDDAPIECWVCFLIRVEDVGSAAGAKKKKSTSKKASQKKSKKKSKKKSRRTSRKPARKGRRR